ncbi:MAG: hypothetical protein WAN11_16890 [Syntrophobacteraceae bacterium]
MTSLQRKPESRQPLLDAGLRRHDELLTPFAIETCIAQMWQAASQIMIWGKVATGKKEQLYKKGEGSSYERLNLLYNASRYAGEENVPEKATMPIWLTNTGIEGKDTKISYAELAEILNEIGIFADKIANPKKHM